MHNSASTTFASNRISVGSKRATYAFALITLCSLFLFYKYILQIYPSMITNQLMHEFQLNGAGLGNLAATFYYAYTVMQLFVGFLLDRYSTRYLTTIAIFISALGAVFFAQAHTLLAASLARSAMGVGVAFATVAYMKTASMWFPPRQYAFVSGLLLTAAMLGAVFGQAPVALLIESFGWRYCLMAIGCAGLFLTILFLVIARDKPQNVQIQPATLKDMFSVLKSKQNWLLTLYAGLAFSPIAVFGGLWGNPFLQQAYHLTKTQASLFLSLIFIGLSIGGPLLGLLSDRLGERRKIMFYGTMLSSILMTLVLYGHPFPLWLLASAFLVMGFSLGCFMLVYVTGKEINPIALTATVIAMINASDAVLDSVTEPLIGKLLDYNWDGKIVDGLHYFSLSNYHSSLAILPLYLLIAALIMIWVKDK